MEHDFGKNLQDVKPQGSKVHKWKYSQVYIGSFADLSSLQRGVFFMLFALFATLKAMVATNPAQAGSGLWVLRCICTVRV